MLLLKSNGITVTVCILRYIILSVNNKCRFKPVMDFKIWP